ncbi:LCM-domain-containing protein [Microthyrium microscopicum]|uniref:tRNA wybutosine-synthesizing protein 4 n=1 Tax=Microthyrium microscopicum TaxID=703497 RepID=A0A6A6UKF8_9PEZI|nr:LCM-domain-containing protein [Microthyrium microscopicum]
MSSKSKEHQDEVATINTNSYSIVSKRSVEKLYFPDEQSFLEAFVPHFRRRAPLINRGYWLRMKAIEYAVEEFLNAPTDRPKAVINLGCGYDPLPFRMRQKGLGNDVLFVDVDYMDLVQRKVKIVLENPKFGPYISSNREICNDGKPVVLRSAQYCAVGIDLGDVTALSDVFTRLVPVTKHDILFVAEVSITYMPLTKANELISWTATFERSKFCVLEQYLPDGPEHPFARTMLNHFAKQSAPIQSVSKYQSLEDHRSRFMSQGYMNVTADSLWHFWEDPSKLSLAEKTYLDTVEPFDEWEEFILFASHYFVLVASNKVMDTSRLSKPSPDVVASNIAKGLEDQSLASRRGAFLLSTHLSIDDKFLSSSSEKMKIVTFQNSASARRFGRAVSLPFKSVAVLGGIHDSSTSEFYSTGVPCHLPLMPRDIVAGHTVTKLGEGSFLLVGGRSSPSKASSSCYLFEPLSKAWVQVHDIKPARYRHNAVPIIEGSTRGVLVFGGRTSTGEVLADWQLWLDGYGWFHLNPTMNHFMSLPSRDTSSQGRFAASMLATGAGSGILMGGLDQDSRICRHSLRWTVKFGSTEEQVLKYGDRFHWGQVDINLVVPDADDRHSLRARVGANLVQSHIGPLLIGGVAPEVIPSALEVLKLGKDGFDTRVSMFPTSGSPRPLLVGISAIDVDPYNIIITGGGAVCFSFGACLNSHWYQLHIDSGVDSPEPLELRQLSDKELLVESTKKKTEHTWQLVPKYCIHEYQADKLTGLSTPVSESLEPCVLRGMDFGPCCQKWDLEYLENNIGVDTKLSIHKGTSRNLLFHPTKNFVYEVQTFSEFKKELEAQSHVYLRSLAQVSPFQQAAYLSRDFPDIANDFQIPPTLNDLFNLSSRIHSSVLRISGDVAVWLHYDVMSNFLFQVRGCKTVTLFSPTEATALGFAPGATVSTLPIETIEARASPSPTGHEVQQDSSCNTVTLHPGDVLFIPRFWLHATRPAESNPEPSVAVNVFWRDLPLAAYAAGRDVYGSRDLAVYENGRTAVKRIADHFKKDLGKDPGLSGQDLVRFLREKRKHSGTANHKSWKECEKLKQKFVSLPDDVGAFYLPRLAQELEQILQDIKPHESTPGSQ